jgi:hypothetical protein
MMKVCSRCKQEKSVTDFWAIWSGKKIRHKGPSPATTTLISTIGNYQQYCKKCCLSWQSNNKDRYKRYQKKYYDNKQKWLSEQNTVLNAQK